MAPTKLTLREFVETRWLPVVAGQLRPSTLASYQRNLRHHVLPTMGALPLQNIDGGRIQSLYSQLLMTGRADHLEGTGLSTRTVRYIHTIVDARRSTLDARRSTLGAAVDWDLIQRNPADRAKPPKLGAAGDRHETIRTWTREQLGAFL